MGKGPETIRIPKADRRIANIPRRAPGLEVLDNLAEQDRVAGAIANRLNRSIVHSIGEATMR